MALCIFCDSELKEINSETFEGIEEKEYHCPNCGGIEFYTSCCEEERENYPYYNEETKDSISGYYGYHGECPICGSSLIWGADFMRSEIYGDVEDEEDDSLAVSLYCPHCGGAIEIIETKPSEQNKYLFYRNKI